MSSIISIWRIRALISAKDPQLLYCDFDLVNTELQNTKSAIQLQKKMPTEEKSMAGEKSYIFRGSIRMDCGDVKDTPHQ